MSTPSPNPSPTAPPRPRRRVVQNTVFSLLAKVQSGLLTYLTTLLLLRALSVENYGLYSVLFSGMIYNLGLLTRLGIPNVLTRFLPVYFSQSKYRLIGEVFRAANRLQTAVALLLVGFTFVFAPQIAGWIKFEGSEAILRVFAVGAFAYLLSENFRLLMAALFQQRTILLVNFIYNVVRLGVIYLVTRQPDPLSKVVVAEGGVFLLLLAVFYVAYRRTIHPLIQQDSHPSERPPWRRFTRYAGLFYVNEVGVALLTSATDLFLVTGLLGGVAAGLYGLADRVLWIVSSFLPSKILQEVIEPLFYSEYGASEPSSARQGFNLLMKVSALASLPMGLWLALMGQPVIVELFDPRFADAAGVLAISGLFLPMIALRFPLGLMLANAERPGLLILAKITGMLKILCGLWLVPQWGVMGMVWIAALASLSQNLVMYGFIVWKLRVHTDYRGLLRIGVNGALSAVIFYPMIPRFTGIAGVVVSAVVFAVVYLAISMVHRAFSKDERDLINGRLPYPLWRF